MKQDQLIGTNNGAAQQNSLVEQIAQLKLELNAVSHKVDAYEALLRSHLAQELIESQELSVLYKEQKQEKKAKRLEQKKKGKNYVEPVGLKTQWDTPQAPNSNKEHAKEKKRLYREAMLHVHPDKFSMTDSSLDLATDLTTRLVEIYQQEDLAALQAYHAHLFSNAEFIKDTTSQLKNIKLTASPDAYLIKEKEQLEQAIHAVKERQIYHVLTSYDDPSVFIEELRAYYQDRINKLRRRTRMK